MSVVLVDGVCMRSAIRSWRAWEREPKWGSGGLPPQLGSGALPLVKGLGAKPLKLKHILVGMANELRVPDTVKFMQRQPRSHSAVDTAMASI